MDNSFQSINLELEADSEKRELINKETRELWKLNRLIGAMLQSIHQSNNCASNEQLKAVALSAQQQFNASKQHWQNIEKIICGNQTGNQSGLTEKFHDQWRFLIQQYIFAAALIEFLLTNQLINQSQCATLFGLTVIPVDVEDFLHGVSSMPKELCRLCVNLVRVGNSAYVNDCAVFVHDLYSGFRLLNLRNDPLRRKVDSIKYDCLKIEEIQYDLAVKKTQQPKEQTADEAGMTDAAI